MIKHGIGFTSWKRQSVEGHRIWYVNICKWYGYQMIPKKVVCWILWKYRVDIWKCYGHIMGWLWICMPSVIWKYQMLDPHQLLCNLYHRFWWVKTPRFWWVKTQILLGRTSTETRAWFVLRTRSVCFTCFGSFVLECVWNSQCQAVLVSLLFNLTYVCRERLFLAFPEV